MVKKEKGKNLLIEEDKNRITKELWLPIKGFEGLYEVSSFGKVKSLDRRVEYTHRWGSKTTMKQVGKIKNLSFTGSGYLFVGLSKNGIPYPKDVHRIVATHFIPNPENKKCVNHKDGNKLNNCVDNLEWCTYSENITHAMKNGLTKLNGGDNPYARGVVIEKEGIMVEFKTQREAAKYIGTKDINVSAAKINKTRCHGYTVKSLK